MLNTPTVADCVALVERLNGFATFCRGWTPGALAYCINKAIAENLFVFAADPTGKLTGFCVAQKGDTTLHITLLVACDRNTLKTFAKYARVNRGLTEVTGYRRFKHNDSIKNAPRIFKLSKI